MISFLRRASFVLLLLIVVGCDEDPVVPQPQPPAAPASDVALIQEFARSYNAMDLAAFTNLFPTADEAEYLFILNEPDPDDGSTSWGRDEELRVHQRMFRPQDTPVGEDPVPPDLVLTQISLQLTQSAAFEERTDLYLPGGALDQERWRATDAQFHAVLFFGTAGETDYAVDGRANFVIIEDRTKTAGEDRKFLIYRWEDLGGFTKAIELP